MIKYVKPPIESTFQTWLIKQMKDAGLRVKKAQSGMGHQFPDLYVVMEGRVVWIELKVIPSPKKSNPTTPIQILDCVKDLDCGILHGTLALAIANHDGVLHREFWYYPPVEKSLPKFLFSVRVGSSMEETQVTRLIRYLIHHITLEAEKRK